MVTKPTGVYLLPNAKLLLCEIIAVPSHLRALDHIHVGTARGFHSRGAAPRQCQCDEPAGSKHWAVGTLPVAP
jgi:hypothetical protein